MDLFKPLSVAVDKETPSRFSSVNISSWNPKAKPDVISFKVDNPNVFLSGIGIFQVSCRLSGPYCGLVHAHIINAPHIIEDK